MPVEVDFEFMAGAIDDMHRQMMMRESRPIYRPVSQSGIVAASPTVIVCPNPVPPGRFWEITGFGAYGLNATSGLPDIHTAVASAIVDFYAGPSVGVDNPGDISSAVGTSGTGVTNWIGDKKAFANAGDKLYAWVYGLTTATTILIKFAVFDWKVEDRVEMSI